MESEEASRFLKIVEKEMTSILDGHKEDLLTTYTHRNNSLKIHYSRKRKFVKIECVLDTTLF